MSSPKADLAAAKQAAQAERIAATLARVRFVLAVMSGKGGVGKSSVAVNLAAGLAAQGQRVGIMDVDLHGPSVAGLLGLSGGLETTGQGRILPKQPDPDVNPDLTGALDKALAQTPPASRPGSLSAVSMASLLDDPDQAVLWRGPMKTSAIRQFVSDVEWGELDYLIIDTPPGTGDEHMTILRTIPSALCVVVTTPQEVSLADVRRAVNFLQYAQAGVLGVVENMSGLICPHCAGEIELFKKGGGADLAKRYGLPFLGAVPLDPATVVAADLGMPVVLLPGESPAKEAFLQLAQKVRQEAERSLEAAAADQD